MHCEDLSNLEEKEIIPKLFDAYGIVLRSKIKLNQKVLSQIKNLAFVARAGSGLENIDREYCKKNRIHVFSSPEGNSNAVAEHLIGMLLGLLNQMFNVKEQLEDGTWERTKNTGQELSSKTIGILGYGNNGSAFARKLAALDTKVLVYDKYKKVRPKKNISPATLEEIMDKVDVLSLHVPLTVETRYLVNALFLSRFKKNVYILNIARGEIVKTKDLIEGLTTGKVLGACLDVLEFEGPGFNVDFSKNKEELEFLLNHKNVVITPHVAGLTKESYYKLSQILVDKILKINL